MIFRSTDLRGANCWDSWRIQVGVSENRGTPKTSILIGFSIINHPFWGTTIFGNTQVKYIKSFLNLLMDTDPVTRRKEIACSICGIFIHFPGPAICREWRPGTWTELGGSNYPQENSFVVGNHFSFWDPSPFAIVMIFIYIYIIYIYISIIGNWFNFVMTGAMRYMESCSVYKYCVYI